MVTRVGDLANFNSLMFSLRENRSRFDGLIAQNSSGKKSHDFVGIASDSARLISFKNRFERIDRFINNIDVVEGRLSMMENAIHQTEELVSKFNVDLVSALSNQNASAQQINGQAESFLGQLVSNLNTRIDGRYLFSGTNTLRRPVDVNDPGFAQPPPERIPSQPNTSYYKGNNQVFQVRVSESSLVTYGVTADAPAFEKLMRALNLARTADVGPPSDKERLSEAKRLAEEVIGDLAGLRTQVGGIRAQIETAKDSHEDFKLILGKQINDVENVDVPELTIRLSDERNLLSSSYQAIAESTRLSILNFL